MSQLFEKIAALTDIHFGAKSDSEQHNIDCLNCVKWFCQQVREYDCDAVIFMGDWFDNRSRLRVDTLHYSWQAISELRKLNLPVYWLIGNHDVYFRHHRAIHSLPYLEGENFFVINELTEISNVLLAPWLTGNEFAEVPGYDVKYVFGHFELPLFLLNENVIMPDRGGLHADHFINCDAVFSGHFHKRQLKVNEHGIPVYYIGNAFPHNFNDLGDYNRGCMILEWGHDPEFVNWPNAPSYERCKVSELLNGTGNPFQHDTTNMIVEVKDDVGLEVEEAMQLKTLLGDNFRELRLRPMNPELDASIETEIGEDAQSVDEMVVEHLRLLDTEGSDFDAELLVALYQGVGTD
jgi:DNA repair exonuclease SbcCD nuclease subunit